MSRPISDSNDKDKTIVIRRFILESEAQLISAYLTKEGIPNFLSNTYMNQMIPFGQGGVGLHINERDKEYAEKLINNLGETNDVSEDDLILDLNHGVVIDPASLQNRKSKIHWMIYLLLVLLILGFLIHSFFWNDSPFKFW